MKVGEQLRSASEQVKGSAAVQQVSAQAHRHGPSLLRQLFGVLVLLVIVIGLLASWNWGQNREDVRDRLWAELVFFGLVIGLGIAVVSPLVEFLTSRLPERFRRYLAIHKVPPYQALIWGLITVLAIPIAMLEWKVGFAILVGASIAFALGFWLLARRFKWMPNLALCWSVLCAAFLLVGYAAVFFSGPVKDFSLPSAEAAVPGADALALRFRPLLFFDRDERDQPVDIGDATVKGCNTGFSGAEGCSDPLGPSDSLSSYAYIKVSGDERPRGQPPGGPESAYYYHALSRGSKVYLDYWWFLEHNPSPFGRSFLCGQGLRWLGEACGQHAGDWEGITVVLVPCEQAATGACAVGDEGGYGVDEVIYAQHEKVVAYPWTVLQEAWSEPQYDTWAASASGRPLVFSALDSHASYALPCAFKCKQIAHSTFRERRDGRLAWTNNDAAGCGSDCLQPLPTDAGEPSAWNAFPGPWGPQSCILFGSYCDARPSPEAPAFQNRFKDPECVPKRCLRPAQVRV
jgi:hypothetical protein